MKKFFFIVFSLIIFLTIAINQIPKNNFVFQNINSLIKTNIPQNVYVFLRLIFNNKKNTLRNLNDYNIEFLPDTQSIKLKFTKIKINDLKAEEQGYLDGLKKKQYSFHITQYNDLLILSANKNLFFVKIDDLSVKKFELKKIKFNLDKLNFSIKDILVHENYLYISLERRLQSCNTHEIYSAKLDNINNLEFKKLFSPKECGERVEAGKIQIWEENSKKYILLSTHISENIRLEDESDPKAQNDNSISGKILIIELDTGKYKIYSKGHRNIIGLYANQKESLILSTENGPRGGDEINLITKGSNYGWDISSYGSKYKSNKLSSDPDYKLSHDEYGFIEPIFSFVPSIGITEIIKIEKNFSNKWENNYIIGSLNSKHIYRLKFDKNYSKIFFYEKIFVGERIRDLLYLKNEKKILMSMEETGSIGVLENFND